MDSGTAYGRPKPSYDAGLVEVGPGTPGGEMLRRYWHPIAVAGEVTLRPRNVRVLGEDLVHFRDGDGRPGLLYPRCCHRGTTLYYGKVEPSYSALASRLSPLSSNCGPLPLPGAGEPKRLPLPLRSRGWGEGGSVLTHNPP